MRHSNYIEILIKVALLPILLCVFVPFAPKMPAPGLDPSWALALNHAIATGLSFGKDIIFTLGPYSSIYTKAYHPATDVMMIAGSFYLVCSFWIALLILMQDRSRAPGLGIIFVLLVMVYARDSLLFMYPLLVALLCNDAVYNKTLPKWALIFAFTPLGLLSLIKGSLLILCIVIVLACCILFFCHKKLLLASVCLLSSILSIAFFWVMAGQSLGNLLGYIASSICLAAGFTESMATTGDFSEIIIYTLASMLILCSILWQKNTPLASRLFLSCVFFAFLFLSFKAGFTRHYGHAYIASTSIILAALLLPYFLNSNMIIPVILFSSYTSYTIASHYTHISISKNIQSTCISAWHGLKSRLYDKDWLNQNFDLSMHYIKERAAFPKIQGQTDIYSYNQAYLIASEASWSPRPVFQSYSVFNSWLSRKNKEHISRQHRPDTLIFSIEPIDERLPSLEDGMSWPVVLTQYKPKQWVNHFLFLTQVPASSPSLTTIKKEHHLLGQAFKIPQADYLVMAVISIQPTYYGTLASIFFKPHPLFINIELHSGIKKQFRLIRTMAKAGFLISPLIENTQEFASLYDLKSVLPLKRVKTISINSYPEHSNHWNEDYVVVFKRIQQTKSPEPLS